MNINHQTLKIALLLVMILLLSCNNNKQLSFDYEINGQLKWSLSMDGVPVSREIKNYSITNHVTTSQSALNNVKNIPDTININGTGKQTFVNNKEDGVNYNYEFGTYISYNSPMEVSNTQKNVTFIVSGNVNSDVRTVINQSDSIYYAIAGTFSDTLVLIDANRKFRHEIEGYAINEGIIPTIQGELTKKIKSLAEKHFNKNY